MTLPHELIDFRREINDFYVEINDFDVEIIDFDDEINYLSYGIIDYVKKIDEFVRQSQ